MYNSEDSLREASGLNQATRWKNFSAAALRSTSRWAPSLWYTGGVTSLKYFCHKSAIRGEIVNGETEGCLDQLH